MKCRGLCCDSAPLCQEFWSLTEGGGVAGWTRLGPGPWPQLSPLWPIWLLVVSGLLGTCSDSLYTSSQVLSPTARGC